MGKKTRKAQRAARGKSAERAGRVGLTARGVMYCVAGFLAVRLATGDHERVDNEGALEILARQRFGTVLLGLLAVGFAGYAVWRFLRAFTGAKEGSSASGNGKTWRRVLDVGRGLIYLTLVGNTAKVIFGGRDEVGGEEKEQAWTATLMSQPWGRWAVFVAGVVVVIGGLVVAGSCVRRDFTEALDSRRVPRWARQVVPVAGTIGYVARGLVVSTAGWLIALAAWQFDPKDAVGVAGALARLSREPYGRVALVGAAFGLFSFGVFSLVEARYRKILED